jgi:hypothetical protein
MRRRLVSGVVLSALAAVMGAGCNKVSTTTPVQPSPTAITESFSGTLTVNGAVTFPFPVTTAGNLTGTLKAIGPDDTAVIGMAIGTFAGTTCQIVLANDNAGKSSIITGVVNASGILCARIYDVGKITGPVTFTIDVNHF